MAATHPSDSDKPYRGRRMSWSEFKRLMADNDNDRRDDEPAAPMVQRTAADGAVR
ncbi:hypothetical protein [Mesorhizobium sp. CA7]|uniref:hypothetical protein n=1 Tax=Mesorhizobium sp. CA7 TaxID=588501 RepID=UPI001CCDB012|nr:hypothetical protein [Mesorhizobium sp. CA7]MBZ9815051.1 hypothetical protein [Mesorhizobium sp. CA7]